ncbi:flippase [Pseudoalteromonas shioyasakiensis]|uniref:flippase n=1 Tax=Pseudoalteromonas shioyasakiensis TaxID=1190813 RepID=UPI0021187E34|nr:flippase [Pseudoalteromonas shioyasakiensis]MCQ8879467.1 flippase [Pseudoalteromonas shioyasakiensis]
MASSVTNSLLLIFEKVILLGLSFINSILLARLAGPTIFGEFSYILSFASFFAPLAVMGLNNIITKYIAKHPRNSHYYISSALKIRLTGAILAIVLAAIITFNFAHKNSSPELIVMLVAMQGFSLFYVIEYYYLAKRQVGILLTLRLTALLLTNTLKLIAILNNATLTTLVILQGLEYVIIGCSYYFTYLYQQHHKVLKKRPTRSTYLALFHKGKWLLSSGIAAILYLKIDQIMIAQLINSEAVAYYAAAAKLSEFWYVFPVLIANVFTAQLSRYKFKNQDRYTQLLCQLISLITLAALILSAIIWLISEPLVLLLYGEVYQQSAAILSVHIFACIFIFQRAILSKWLIIEKLYKFSLLSSLLGAMANILLNLILIPKYQGLGAAWATVISYMLASYGFLFFNTKTKQYAQLLHQAILHTPSIVISSIKQLISHR